MNSTFVVETEVLEERECRFGWHLEVIIVKFEVKLGWIGSSVMRLNALRTSNIKMKDESSSIACV